MPDSTLDLVTSSPQLRVLLAGDDIDPPMLLWSRIMAARTQQQVWQRRRRLLVGSLALAASLFGMLLLPRWAEQTPDNAGQTDWKLVAQQLEMRLQNLDRTQTGQDHRLLPEQAALQALDHSLQTAYDHAASNAELMALWQRRCALLNTLLAIRSQSHELIRI